MFRIVLLMCFWVFSISTSRADIDEEIIIGNTDDVESDAGTGAKVQELVSFSDQGNNYGQDTEHENRIFSNFSEKELILWRNIATSLMGLSPLVALMLYFTKANKQKPSMRFVVLTSTSKGRLATGEGSDVVYVWGSSNCTGTNHLSSLTNNEQECNDMTIRSRNVL